MDKDWEQDISNCEQTILRPLCNLTLGQNVTSYSSKAQQQQKSNEVYLTIFALPTRESFFFKLKMWRILGYHSYSFTGNVFDMTHTFPFRFVRPCIVGPTGQAGASLDPGPRMVRWTVGHFVPNPVPGLCSAWQTWRPPHEWAAARDVQAVAAKKPPNPSHHVLFATTRWSFLFIFVFLCWSPR